MGNKLCRQKNPKLNGPLLSYEGWTNHDIPVGHILFGTDWITCNSDGNGISEGWVRTELEKNGSLYLVS